MAVAGITAAAAALSALVGVGSLVTSATRGGPDIPEPANLPRTPAAPPEIPEPAPVQPQTEEPTPRQRARRAGARARQAAASGPQTILTSALGATQLPQNVRRTILG